MSGSRSTKIVRLQPLWRHHLLLPPIASFVVLFVFCSSDSTTASGISMGYFWTYASLSWPCTKWLPTVFAAEATSWGKMLRKLRWFETRSWKKATQYGGRMIWYRIGKNFNHGSRNVFKKLFTFLFKKNSVIYFWDIIQFSIHFVRLQLLLMYEYKQKIWG